MFEVRDTHRVLQFEGTHLGHSTSWRRDSYRWVEFDLYRTNGGSYVLSRTGQTMLYHDPHCAVVARNGLGAIPAEALTEGHVACPDCRPSFDADEVCPESPRHWAMVSETAEGVLEALYRFDDASVRYLTSVAQRLLDAASDLDPKIASVYRTETIA